MLVRKPGKKALVIALRGDLGAGKTTFTQGFFRGLGIKRNPISPTFVIMRRYALHAEGFRNVYHFDAYRLKKEEDMEVLGVRKDPDGPKEYYSCRMAGKDTRRFAARNRCDWILFMERKRMKE